MKSFGRIVVLAFIPALLFLNKPAFAEEEKFTSSYKVLYNVSEKETRITQNITLTNRTSDMYATEYSLTVGSPHVKDVTATANKNNLNVKTDASETSTTITISFSSPVVGLGKSVNVVLSYTSLDNAQKNGRVWEITIPRLAPDTTIDNYDVSVQVPKSFGPLMYVSPTPEKNDNAEFYQFDFTKDQVQAGGASATFGDYQLFTLDLTYHLVNPKSFSGTETIAFPPSVAGRQEIIVESIEPQPKRVLQDEDGNYLAEYQLTGKKNLDVVFKGYARVYQDAIGASQGGEFSDLPVKIVEQYTKPQPFWEVDSAEINTEASSIIDKDKNVAENAKAIYDYVSTHLTYDQNSRKTLAERAGALETFKNPKNSICMGYTDLFIALARSAGIPARELNGYAYTADNALRPLSIEFRGSDVLHAWPEFYDPHLGWVAIDPTWGSTMNGLDYFSKLDTNHIVFSVKGLSSETPLPAGAYKIAGDEGNDVKVSFADPNFDLNSKAPSISVDFDFPEKSLAGLPVSGKLIVKNNGNRTAFGVKTELNSNSVEVTKGKESKIGDLMPFETKEIPITVRAPGFNVRADEDLTLVLGYKNFDDEVKFLPFKKHISIYPFFQFPLSLIHLLIFIPILVVVGIFIYKKFGNHLALVNSLGRWNLEGKKKGAR